RCSISSIMPRTTSSKRRTRPGRRLRPSCPVPPSRRRPKPPHNFLLTETTLPSRRPPSAKRRSRRRRPNDSNSLSGRFPEACFVGKKYLTLARNRVIPAMQDEIGPVGRDRIENRGDALDVALERKGGGAQLRRRDDQIAELLARQPDRLAENRKRFAARIVQDAENGFGADARGSRKLGHEFLIAAKRGKIEQVHEFRLLDRNGRAHQGQRDAQPLVACARGKARIENLAQ